jgi:hypothetical protein
MSKYPGRVITDLAPAGYSVFFDGTGDFLTVTYPVNWSTYGSYTLEFWFYTTSIAATNYAFVSTGGTGYTNFYMYGSSGAYPGAIAVGIQGTNEIRSANSVIAANTWYHIAYTFDGTTTRIFVNGVLVASGTTAVYPNNSANLVIGNGLSNNFTLGNISNLRLVQGTALYTAAFTPPTQLLRVTNTQLLTCNSPAIIDQSSNAFTITPSGNAAVSTLTPFTPYVPYNPALGASTPGIWTVDEAMQAAATRQWNMYDPYFNLNTLLLHGNGTNGAQNNTFLDSSSNNFTITRNGNTTQGSFSPFSQVPGYWSNYFDGSGNGFINVLDAGSVLDLPGDFTLEFWSYQNALATINGTLNLMVSVNTLDLFQIYQDASSFIFIINSATVISTATRPAFNVWNHLALVRSGTTITFYLNGLAVATGSSSFSMTCTSMTIGGQNRSGATSPSSVYHGYNGYMSNFRLVKGTAVYTTNFTPSTTPLTAISGTSLLTCQSNRFVDASSNALSISPVGSTAAVQPFSPFYPTAAYTPQTIGGSGFFDGTGDYLSSATSTDLQLGSSDFSLEWWEYRTAANNVDTAIVCGDGTFSALLGYYNSGAVRFYLSTTGSSWNVFSDTSAGTTASNSWNHFVLTRSGTAFRVFLNGVLGAYATGSGSVTQTTNQIFISGGINGSSAPMEGYISGVRFVKGSIPTSYQTSSTTTNTSIFTSPTAPVTTTSQGATSGDVKYLVNFTNAGVVDSTAKNDLETVGNAQISTTQSKFGGSSMFFDGTGDFISIRRTNLLLPVANQDFTFECWVYPTATPGAQGATIMGCGEYGTDDNWNVNINSSLQVSLYIWSANNSYTNTTRTVTVNAWNHIAVARFGTGTNNLKVFVNGIGQSFSVNNTLVGPTRNFSIGADENGDESVYTGYIDELRFTLGVGRYTADFTPQTSQWQDQ